MTHIDSNAVLANIASAVASATAPKTMKPPTPAPVPAAPTFEALTAAIEKAKTDRAASKNPKTAFILWDEKAGTYIVRQIKASGKPLHATVRASGVEFEDAAPKETVEAVPVVEVPAEPQPTAAPKARKERKARAPKASEPKVDDPKKEKIREMILDGAGCSDVAKALGCRRGVARRVLKAELKKLGVAYVAGIRIKDGAAFTPEAAPKRERKARSAVAISNDAPVRFEVREAPHVERGIVLAIFDSVTDTRIGCFGRTNLDGAQEAARLADRFATMAAPALTRYIADHSADEDKVSVMIARKVLAILAA